MSLFGSMNTAVSGMNAQANRLSTVSDNIANANTTGYKKASTSFSSMVLPSTMGNYNSGGIQTSISRAIMQQGDISYTTSKTDLAISGSGFFVVEDATGSPYLTRDGSFQPDANGNLVNSAGYTLMGYPYGSGAPSTVVNGFGGMSPINLNNSSLSATPTTNGEFAVNLPSNANAVGTAIADVPPSENSAYSAYTEKFTDTSVNSVTGEKEYTDIYYAKTDDNTWEVTVVANDSGTPASFPYDLSGGDIHMASTILTFDPDTGALVSGDPKVYPDPSDPYYYDFSSISQQLSGAGSSDGLDIKVNMPSDTPAIDTAGGDVPASANVAAATYTEKKTYSGYAGLSGDVDLDVYLTKTGTDTWEVAVYDSADATAGGFPYGASGSAPLATSTLTYDPTTGTLVSGGQFSVTLPGGDSWPIDLSGSVSVPSSTSGWEDGASISFNLPGTASALKPYVLGATPAQNQADSTYSNKTSIIADDYLGNPVQLDIYYTKGADNRWEVTVFNHADASSSGFPYSSAPLATTVLDFDPQNGQLEGDDSLSFQIPHGADFTLDLTGTTQVATGFSVTTSHINGSGVSAPTGWNISDDGIVSAQYADGSSNPVYRIALADVESPDNLTVVNGNAYSANGASGNVVMGFPTSAGLGSIKSGALEGSNVDLASELTTMIEAQKSYTAGSKVFQTGSDLLDVLVNLQR